jgi:hypothetical protein
VDIVVVFDIILELQEKKNMKIPSFMGIAAPMYVCKRPAEHQTHTLNLDIIHQASPHPSIPYHVKTNEQRLKADKSKEPHNSNIGLESEDFPASQPYPRHSETNSNPAPQSARESKFQKAKRDRNSNRRDI